MMPLPFLLTSSDGFVGGGAYTRFKGVALSGTYVITTSAGTLSEGVGGIALVQPGPAISTAGVRAQVVSTAAVSLASLDYIAQTSGAIISSSGGAAMGGVPAYTGMGAAIMYDAGNNRIMVYSTLSSQWLATAALTTS